jgi:hypothetical protein
VTHKWFNASDGNGQKWFIVGDGLQDETIQKIHIVNLSRCIIYLAKEIDKLAKSIK